jgi:hypothetical protein
MHSHPGSSADAFTPGFVGGCIHTRVRRRIDGRRPTGDVVSEHEYGAGTSYTAGVIDVEGLREYRVESPLTNWLKDLRTEYCRAIYDRELYPKNSGSIAGPSTTTPTPRQSRKRASGTCSTGTSGYRRTTIDGATRTDRDAEAGDRSG